MLTQTITDVLIVPPREELDLFLAFLKKHPGINGRDMPEQFQDVLLLKYCIKKGLVEASPHSSKQGA